LIPSVDLEQSWESNAPIKDKKTPPKKNKTFKMVTNH